MLLGILAPELLGEATSMIRDATRDDPADAIVWTVLVSTQLFFKAEHGHNPKVRTLNDALVYVSTNLSVGYCDIFAMTERGKQIGSILMTFGPALAAKALDETAEEKRKAEATAAEKHGEMLARLDRIAALLEANTASLRVDIAPDTIRT